MHWPEYMDTCFRSDIYCGPRAKTSTPGAVDNKLTPAREAAFDSVPRRLLAVSMMRLGVEQDLVHILMLLAFHEEAQRWTKIGDHYGAVKTSQGKKQGCKMAPFLYICFTVMVLDALQLHFHKAWIQEGVTIYADDQWTAWLVRSREDLAQALQGVEAVAHILGEHGLVVNAAKSAVLYHLKGKDVHKELRRYMHKKEGQKYMQINGPQGGMQIPVRASHEYLGTVFSYRDAENQALQHGLKRSRGQYAMLRSVILARRVLGMQHRFRIWQAGVLSSACYGLGATGLTINGKIQLQAMVSKHLRAIASLPAHVTHIPNSEINATMFYNLCMFRWSNVSNNYMYSQRKTQCISVFNQ